MKGFVCFTGHNPELDIPSLSTDSAVPLVLDVLRRSLTITFLTTARSGRRESFSKESILRFNERTCRLISASRQRMNHVLSYKGADCTVLGIAKYLPKNSSMTESYKSTNADEINIYIKLCEKYDEGNRLFFDKSFTRST